MDWLDDLETLFTKAVKTTCDPEVGVIFSSGVDSTLVSYIASRFSKVTAYTVGIKGSQDIEYAKRLEPEAPFNIKYIGLTTVDVESTIPQVLSIWRKPNPIDVGVGIPMYLASKAASKDGLNVVLCGQGGDELFGGYWRYLECLTSKGPDAVVEWMEKDWVNAYADNLDRDITLNKANGCELRSPYLNESFSTYVRKMPLDLKIREKSDLVCDEINGRQFVRKYALKKLAQKVGVPDYIINRLKKAAQYGSGTNKTLDKIARMRGYKEKASNKERRDYLNMYLEEFLTSK